MFAAVLTSFLVAISFVCGTQSSKLLGGTEANFWRLTLATVLLAGWAYTFGQGASGDSFPLFLASGAVGVGSDVFLFQSLPRIGSRLSLLITQCFSAISAAAVESIWLKTNLSLSQAGACALVLAGVAVALAPGKHLHVTGPRLAAGVGFGMLAAIGNGFGAVFSRKAYAVAALAGQNIDGATANYQRLIGGLFIASVSLLIVKRDAVAAQLNEANPQRLPALEKWRRAGPWVIGNGLAGQTLGMTCCQWALKTTPAGLVLAIVATAPLVVIPMSRVLEHERVAPRSLIGGAIAVMGAVLLIAVR